MEYRKVEAVTHELKCWAQYFYQIIEGNKRFEARVNDRGYKVGDILYLKEWLNEDEKYTGREYKVVVKYILYGGEFGIEKGNCIMSIEPIEPKEDQPQISGVNEIKLIQLLGLFKLDKDVNINQVVSDITKLFSQPTQRTRQLDKQ